MTEIDWGDRALLVILDEMVSKHNQATVQGVEFDRRAKQLGGLQHQVFNVLKGDVLDQIPHPDLFRRRRDVDDPSRLECLLDR
ncbi:hypothetical protein [Mesorhizobium loti]|uniref:hypothetical protein n=1 Tax=Rhizobium loti TaxID=381 RepID=UPI0012DB543A|nr:hypothetical protein [Mesorhizobium loti]